MIDKSGEKSIMGPARGSDDYKIASVGPQVTLVLCQLKSVGNTDCGISRCVCCYILSGDGLSSKRFLHSWEVSSWEVSSFNSSSPGPQLRLVFPKPQCGHVACSRWPLGALQILRNDAFLSPPLQFTCRTLSHVISLEFSDSWQEKTFLVPISWT